MQLKLCEHKNLHRQILREKKKEHRKIKGDGKGHLNRSGGQKVGFETNRILFY